MLKRRLRGLFASVLGGAIVGVIGGLTIGLLFWLTPGPKTITISPQFPGAVLIVPTLWFAFAGAVSGGAFGTLLMLTERGRSVAELRWYRMAIWAAVPTLGAMRLAGASWPLAAMGVIVGAGIGAGATFLAKRGVALAAAEIQPPPT
jgi:hypothetical protein